MNSYLPLLKMLPHSATSKVFFLIEKRMGGEKGLLLHMYLLLAGLSEQEHAAFFYHFLSITQKPSSHPILLIGFSNFSTLDKTHKAVSMLVQHSPSSLEVSCLTTDNGERVGGLPSG